MARTNFFLDKYGCSANVRKLLRNIAALAWERRRLPNSDKPLVTTSMLSTLDVIHEARALEAELMATIEYDENAQPVFLPDILESLTADQVSEFITCNQIYEHMLLLYLRAEVLRLVTASSEVQEPVRKIITLASLITPHRGLSPSTGLNTALFIAGCHALPSDRPAILDLLSSFFTSTQNYNMCIDIR
ncbi:hypothetical protein G7054_g1198 [Neopestalotiopsis clavispora]|nr:hypothetical protein G7054_g1198 [Neopestalotiopsis clavispora]